MAARGVHQQGQLSPFAAGRAMPEYHHYAIV